jgi:hypothetical protein
VGSVCDDRARIRLRRPELRVAAFLLAGAFAVHQLRYLIAFGGHTEEALARHGHGYLAFAAPVVGWLTALVLARVLVRGASRVPVARAPAVRLTRLWPAATSALLTLYCSQELIEGLLAAHHPMGWAGVVGGGGWTAAPLALVFGAIVAAGLKLAADVEARGLRIACAPALRLPVGAVSWVLPGDGARRRPGSVLGGHFAGRAPPLLSV